MAYDPFLGEIQMVGFDFVPEGWAACDGQLLSISQNSALFSLLGTQYGGNGTSNFALPDLRGRFPMNAGAGPGLSERYVGESGGAEPVPSNLDLSGDNTSVQSDLPPYLAVNFVIAVQGVFPSRQ
jgi:microcystin-dependent protein